MADLTYSVAIDTASAQKNLNALEKNIDQLNNRFTSLRGVIAGVGFGALVGTAIQYADAIQDLSNATGIATANLMGFTKAVQANGGNTESATAGILKLVNAIGTAADGSASAQSAFAQVGVSLNDLATLSEQDILAKTVQGLNKITDTSTRAKIQTELFGKSLRGVDMPGVAAGYDKATRASEKYADSIQQAAQLQDKLDAAVGRLKLSLLQTLEPFMKFINEMSDQQVNKMIDSIVQLAVAIAALAVAAKSIEWLAKGLLFLQASSAAVALGGISLAKTFSAVGTRVRGFNNAIAAGVPVVEALGKTISIHAGKTLPNLAKGLFMVGKGLLGWVGAIWLANDALAAFSGKGFIEWLDTALNKIPGVTAAMASLRDMMGMQSKEAAEADKRLQEAMKDTTHAKRSEEIAKQAIVTRKIKSDIDQQTQSVIKLGDAYRLQNAQALKNLATETELLGKSDYAIAMAQAEIAITEKNKDAVDKLTQAKVNYLNTAEKIQPEIIAAYDKEIRKIKESLAADIERVKVATDGYQMRLQSIEQFNARLEEMAQAEAYATRQGEALTEVYMGLVKPLELATANIKHRNELEKLSRGMGEYQIETLNQLLDLEERQLAAIKEIKDNTLLTADAQGVLTQRVKEAYTAQSTMLKAQREDQYAYSRQFSTGWGKAFMEYTNNATNAARMAGDQFRAFTNFVDSAIDQMVDNGKISFKGLVDSLIKELLKSELKNAIGQVAGAIGGMGSGGGGGGGGGGGIGLGDIWNFGKSLLGFADGGQPPVGKASIVGERGPELFIPKTAGTIVPNGGGAGGNTVINNYNISAVDAKSVAQLFAENRRALLGTVRAAEKELPYRGR